MMKVCCGIGTFILAIVGSSLLTPTIAFAATHNHGQLTVNSRHHDHNNLMNYNGQQQNHRLDTLSPYRYRNRFGGSSIRNRNQNSAQELSMIPMIKNLRGGSIISKISETPSSLFNASFISLAVVTAIFKIFQQRAEASGASSSESSENSEKKPAGVISLQRRFLVVFWLLRCADWLQGPYFYEVYASKVFNGVKASLPLVSKLFVTGFASTAIFGPWVGRAADTYGRKAGTLAFALIYSLGASSTKSSILPILLLGRVLSGIGTSLLFSAPEAWLVGESQKPSTGDSTGKYLGETFGLAYAGDAIVAILAGQLAGAAASKRGPTGPFELSIGFLTIGGLLASLLWKENVATSSSSKEDEKSSTSSDDEQKSTKPSIRDAIAVVKDDPKIMLVGAVQSLFEAAMYIFVLQWPPAISGAISKAFAAGASVPYGTIFSCFMTCCLLGSTLFGQLAKMSITTELSTSIMLLGATVSMGLASYATTLASLPLKLLIPAFFVFEFCVGMYFPSIGTLRSKYIPDSHRSVIMNLFGIPLNILVVSVFLTIKQLGLSGALSISTGALGVAALSMLKLQRQTASANK